MRVIAAILLLPGLGPAAQEEDRDRIDLLEVEEPFRKKWAAAEAAGNAKELLRLYDVAYDSYSNRLIQPEPGVKRWIRVPLHLAARISALPEKELEAREIVARQVFETVLEPASRRKMIEKYAFTRAGRDALQQMANLDCDAGRLTEAVRAWARAVDARPTADLVARLAHAHSLRGDSVALLALHSLVEHRGLEGDVTIGGRKRQLQEYLDTLTPAGATPPLLKPAPPGPTNEIPLGRLEFPGGPWGRGLATSLPAAGRVNGKDLVVATNGNTVFAIDPSRAEGGRLDDAVAWRYPADGGVRSYLNAYQTASLGTALPYVGAAVDGGRAYVTMFTRMDQKPEQVGRRSEKFEGPAALRAFNLATGELLWDTETLEIERDGAKVRLMEHLKFDLLNFCFGGPPLLRGDRLYAAVMKSPLTPRRCFALCLDARTGGLIWHQEIGGVPPTRGTASIVSLSEEEGTLVVATNFGIVAALDSGSGEFEWAAKGGTPDLNRTAASPPVLSGSQVYVLAQNNRELMAFDRWTGRETPLPAFSEEVPWESLSHLVGRAGDWLVFSGSRNLAIRVADGRVVRLTDGEEERRGRGAIARGLVYLPTRTALQIFDASTWKLRDAIPWPENREAGNVTVTESLCLHAADRLDVYTSAPLLMERFEPRVEATPPRPEACRQLGLLLEGAGRAREAARYYRRALKVWENDPAWQETALGLRKRLAEIAAKLGDEPKDE